MRYEQLCDFVKAHAHALVPKEQCILNCWVISQRMKYKKNQLTDEKIRLLNEIRFIWDVSEYHWHKTYKTLKAFFSANAHLNIPNDHKEHDYLYQWVSNQRGRYKQNKLSREKIQKLDDIHFIWDAIQWSWENNYWQLAEFHKRFGHSDVKYKDGPYLELAKWCASQRVRYKKSRITSEQIAQLNELDFNWTLFDSRWHEMYCALERFYHDHDHSNLSKHRNEYQALWDWCATQRRLYTIGELNQERIGQLEQLAFEWRPLSNRWMESYKAFKSAYEQYGSLEAIYKSKDGVKLKTWIKNQRNKYKINGLSQDRIELLNKLGDIFVDTHEQAWNEQYECLKDHYNTSQDHQSTLPKQLRDWIVHQRQREKINKLPTKRKALLEAVGIDFSDTKEANWLENFNHLKEFYNQYRYCDLSPDNPHSKTLSTWCRTQRSDYQSGTLKIERQNLLNTVGFNFEIHKNSWHTHYDALKTFFHENGHSHYPTKEASNPQLAHWVATQRQRYKQNRLSAERVALLEKLNFAWDMKRVQWLDTYAQLLLFYKSNGHCKVPAQENKKLHDWVSRQRAKISKGELSTEFMALLRKLGFMQA